MQLFWLIREGAWRELGWHLLALIVCGAVIVLLALAFTSVAPGEPAPKRTPMCSDVGNLRDNLVIDECGER